MDQPPHGHPLPWLCAATTFFGIATERLARVGLDWATLATLLGGLGLVIQSAVAASKEVRAWADRRPPRTGPRAACPAPPKLYDPGQE